jgi:serine-type D-Ala-D-Ala carboxypeptidase/endopeptidase (penicillin-binding protein 4)
MQKILFTIFILLSITLQSIAQKWKEPMKVAIEELQKEPTMKHALISFTVIDAATGEVVYAKNSDLGLPTASTQKVITAICAYELLGNQFRYETNFAIPKINKTKKSTLFVNASYDPTLGSWRYANTNSDKLLDTLSILLKKNKIDQVKVIANPMSRLNGNYISDAWIYEDLGNYYGAACEPLMWRENQYDIKFNTQKNAQMYTIKNTNPSWVNDILEIQMSITKGANGSGDNTCIYRMPFSNIALAKGTLGADVESSEISGSIEGGNFFSNSINRTLNKSNVSNQFEEGNPNAKDATIIYKHKSPTLDSITYWFLRKSINLYGEALLRTMGIKKYNNASYESGITYIHTICKKLNIDTAAVHIFDGCGLSPQNRISTKALATFMQYAHGKDYYKQFYNCLPILNDISMKSGSIHGARAYTGYVTSSDEHVYTFAIAVNNFDGSGKDMQSKLWKVLDVLK